MVIPTARCWSGGHHLVVDRQGRLLITDEVRGIVEDSPGTGDTSAFVPVETLGVRREESRWKPMATFS